MGETFADIGQRGADVWDGEPEGVYVPTGAPAPHHRAGPTRAEVFVAGARFDEVAASPSPCARDELDVVQYGSDDTKTHRKIKHILGAKHHDRVGRLLVSELFTVGAGRLVGLPEPQARHRPPAGGDAPRRDLQLPLPARPRGSGLQMLQRDDDEPGDAYHVVDGSTVLIDKGYHPCCVLPGYEMYYFTILGGPQPAQPAAVLPADPCRAARTPSPASWTWWRSSR